MIIHENRLLAEILMKYHALFAIFEKRQNLKLSSAANHWWHIIRSKRFRLVGGASKIG